MSTQDTTAPGGATGRPWRGRSPAQRRAERRRRLMEAGFQLFGTQGYSATSLTAVVATAGVSPRHFYELFDDREQLLRAIYDEIIAEDLRRLRAAVTVAELDVQARAEAGLRAVIEFLTEDPRRARIIMLEIIGVSRELEQHRRAVIRGFARLLEEQYELLLAAGRIPPQPSGFSMLAIGLVGAVDEVLVDWLLRDPQPPAEELLPPLVRLHLAAFTAG